MKFCQIYEMCNQPALILNGTEIHITHQHKFLGITLDSKLYSIFQTTEDKMQPSHTTREPKATRTEILIKGSNEIIHTPNTIKA